MKVHLLSFRPDIGALMRLASRERLLPPGDDLGYAWHAVLAASFGPLAPTPFVHLPSGSHGGGPAGRLLAYSAAPLSQLRDHAASFADPQFVAPLQLDDAADKVMPGRLREGTRLGFQVRVRPVARSTEGRGSDRSGPRGERDVFLREFDRAGGHTTRARGDCYRDWLAGKLLSAGANLVRARLTAFAFTRLRMRDRGNGASRPHSLEGPDAWFRGELSVADPELIPALLSRGVGRHRAFGFGMVLLSPPEG